MNFHPTTLSTFPECPYGYGQHLLGGPGAPRPDDPDDLDDESLRQLRHNNPATVKCAGCAKAYLTDKYGRPIRAEGGHRNTSHFKKVLLPHFQVVKVSPSLDWKEHVHASLELVGSLGDDGAGVIAKNASVQQRAAGTVALGAIDLLLFAPETWSDGWQSLARSSQQVIASLREDDPSATPSQLAARIGLKVAATALSGLQSVRRHQCKLKVYTEGMVAHVPGRSVNDTLSKLACNGTATGAHDIPVTTNRAHAVSSQKNRAGANAHDVQTRGSGYHQDGNVIGAPTWEDFYDNWGGCLRLSRSVVVRMIIKPLKAGSLQLRWTSKDDGPPTTLYFMIPIPSSWGLMCGMPATAAPKKGRTVPPFAKAYELFGRVGRLEHCRGSQCIARFVDDADKNLELGATDAALRRVYLESLEAASRNTFKYDMTLVYDYGPRQDFGSEQAMRDAPIALARAGKKRRKK
jgi:hypothetical protein